jgi:tRNA threonylcarbamoyladenosine biosynthesis protein TsaB
MRTLALESSGMAGEVALLDDERVVAEVVLPGEQRTAQSLAPSIAEAVSLAGWKARDVELVAVSIGPGSFTGLRVGVTTAKVFAYAAKCEVLGIGTLRGVAANVEVVEGAALWTVLDAQRQQLFAAKFRGVAGAWECEVEAHVVDHDAWLARLASGDIVSGSGLKRLTGKLAGVKVLGEEHWTPRANAVGRLAYTDYLAGRRDDLWRLTPHYLRPSAAEEKASPA